MPGPGKARLGGFDTGIDLNCFGVKQQSYHQSSEAGLEGKYHQTNHPCISSSHSSLEVTML